LKICDHQKWGRTSIAETSTIVPITKSADNSVKTNADTEVMAETDILLNGKLKRYFSFKEFKSILVEPDSIQLLSEVESCTNIFQEDDGSIDPGAKYLYKNGSRFECSQSGLIDVANETESSILCIGGSRVRHYHRYFQYPSLYPN